MFDMNRASVIPVSDDKTYVQETMNIKFAQGESSKSDPHGVGDLIWGTI